MCLAGVFYYLPNVNDFIVEVLVGSLNSQVKQSSSCILKGNNLGFYFSTKFIHSKLALSLLFLVLGAINCFGAIFYFQPNSSGRFVLLTSFTI